MCKVSHHHLPLRRFICKPNVQRSHDFAVVFGNGNKMPQNVTYALCSVDVGQTREVGMGGQRSLQFLDQQKQVRFFNAQSRFEIVVLDGVLGPPLLGCHT